METNRLNYGRLTLRTHNAAVCEGRACCVHSPSDHHMKDFPLIWRGDRRIMERECPHGVGHPDPDDVAYHLRQHPEDRFYSSHGCDGCCVPPTPPVPGPAVPSEEEI